MAVELNGYLFPEGRVTVEERLEEVGGQDGRAVVLRGLTAPGATVEAVEVALDAVLAASSEEGLVALSLRAGRRLWVRRTGFTREPSRGGRVGSYLLTLEAEVPWEESVEETSRYWAVTALEDAIPADTAGNTWTLPRVTLTALGALESPGITDGMRTIACGGTVSAGETVVFDGPAGVVTRDGVDVTAYATGDFPRVAPGGGTLAYTAAGGIHQASAEAAWRDRWW